MKKTSNNPDVRTQLNSGFAVYVGAKRVDWSHHEDNAIATAREHVKTLRTQNRFVPTVTVFDCALILNVAFITDDSNGITIHRPNKPTEHA